MLLSIMLDKSLSLRVCYLTSKNHEHNLPLIFLNISLNINVIRLEFRSSRFVRPKHWAVIRGILFWFKTGSTQFSEKGWGRLYFYHVNRSSQYISSARVTHKRSSPKPIRQFAALNSNLCLKERALYLNVRINALQIHFLIWDTYTCLAWLIEEASDNVSRCCFVNR